ncbi:hypothetical protein K438DRAFT_1997645 [Mycena galopus ATCC 62051]|nr:hypothetical protein K438DRAFT_1997645 [Mycena galopus ATCC 62051]
MSPTHTFVDDDYMGTRAPLSELPHAGPNCLQHALNTTCKCLHDMSQSRSPSSGEQQQFDTLEGLRKGRHEHGRQAHDEHPCMWRNCVCCALKRRHAAAVMTSHLPAGLTMYSLTLACMKTERPYKSSPPHSTRVVLAMNALPSEFAAWERRGHATHAAYFRSTFSYLLCFLWLTFESPPGICDCTVPRAWSWIASDFLDSPLAPFNSWISLGIAIAAGLWIAREKKTQSMKMPIISDGITQPPFVTAAFSVWLSSALFSHSFPPGPSSQLSQLHDESSGRRVENADEPPPRAHWQRSVCKGRCPRKLNTRMVVGESGKGGDSASVSRPPPSEVMCPPRRDGVHTRYTLTSGSGRARRRRSNDVRRELESEGLALHPRRTDRKHRLALCPPKSLLLRSRYPTSVRCIVSGSLFAPAPDLRSCLASRESV